MSSNVHRSGRWAKAALLLGLTMAFTTPEVAFAGTDNGDFAIEEIVVSARKREESLKDVPVSVAAFTSLDIEKGRIDDVTNLFGKVPGLYFSSNVLSPGKDFINLVIRGVGALTTGSPSTATFLDGVYMPALGFDTTFLDLERIEILRGPQGTLFGRNTEGGALNIVTRKPGDEFRAKVAFEVDEFNTFKVQGMVGGPLSDRVFINVAGEFTSTDGYLNAPTISAQLADVTGTFEKVAADSWRRFSGRVALRMLMSDNLEVNIAVDGSDRKGLDGLPGVPTGCNCYDVMSDFLIDNKYSNVGGSVTVDYSASWADITSITGYRKLKALLPFDFDGRGNIHNNVHDLQSNQQLMSEELRFTSNDDTSALRWVAGVYGFKEDQNTSRRYSLLEIGAFPGIVIDLQDQFINRKGYAFFGQASYALSDRLDLTVGTRYSWEKVASNFALDFRILDLFGPGADFRLATTDIDDDTFTGFTPMASLSFKLTDDVMTYFTYSRGFKAGGFPSAPTGASNIAFKEEKSENFEIGAKASLLDHRLSVDLSVFYINLTNQQVATIVFINDDPSLPVAATANAGKSRSKGFDLSVKAVPVEGLILDLSVGYVDATYLEYVDTVGKNRAGEAFPFVPKWTVSFGGEYTFEITEGYDLTLAASYRYVDDILSGAGVDVDFQFPIKSYNIIDAYIALRRDNWRFVVFADNLTDNYIETRIFNSFFVSSAPDGLHPNSILLPPRRVGARLSLEF
jgi:iron complex outermembrane receptor protein